MGSSNANLSDKKRYKQTQALKPIEKYSYIESPIEAIMENIKYPWGPTQFLVGFWQYESTVSGLLSPKRLVQGLL